jgi:hypothetical protein
VAKSTKPRIEGIGLFHGYRWWLGRTFSNGRDLRWTAGFGYGARCLFVWPEFGLAVAVTAGDYASSLSLRGIIPPDILAQHVLPAIDAVAEDASSRRPGR